MANAPQRPTSRTSSYVYTRIKDNDPWYVSSQFEWAEKLSTKWIYHKRAAFILDCIQREKARLGSNVALLDAGCGDGYWLSLLQKLDGLHLTGVDYNPLRLERAKRVAPDAAITQGDLNDHSLSRKQFDIVLLSHVIEHVEDDVGLLKMVKSLLRPGGVMILGTPNEGSRLQQWALRRAGGRAVSDHVHFYTEPLIRKKIMESKFSIDRVMREVFYPGDDRLYYGLLAHSWGFWLLERMTELWPGQCSGYYFECHTVASQFHNQGDID